jgi:hypothetical protein
VRIGYRSFDRQWLIPDKRVINQPNPSLWMTRSDRQVYLTALSRTSPVRGPAVTLTALVPDLDHFHGRGGRVLPLWRDVGATTPNVAPRILDLLGERCGGDVSGPALLAYVAAVLSHPGYTARFRHHLALPGLRVPLTSDPKLFLEAVQLGRRVVWLQTHGERFADPANGRPSGPPRLPSDRRPKVVQPIADDAARMPEELQYLPGSGTLLVGTGRISPVPVEVMEYEVSGMNVVRKWFGYRKRDPEGRRVSELDRIVADRWTPAFTTELLELLNVLALLIDLHDDQADLLDRIVAGPLISVEDLTAAGVLPVPPRSRRPPTEIEARSPAV